MPGLSDQPRQDIAAAGTRSRPGRAAFGLGIFLALTVAIFSWMPKTLFDFDASHYTTVAYDIDRWHTFSNGLFDGVDSTKEAPPPGMFFGPVYPAIVAAAIKLDPRFKRAVECWIKADARNQNGNLVCERYAAPMLVLHALLVALGILAAARAGELIFASERVFWIAGVVATVGSIAESELFSFVMTESTTIGLYGAFSLACVMAWTRVRWLDCVLAGALLGLLILLRPSFQVLLPVGLALMMLAAWRASRSVGKAASRSAVFALACAIVVAPWIVRNAVSVGRIGLTEQYGSASIIERVAFDDMTAREYALMFPYCLPGVGEPLVAWLFGKEAMHRFTYFEPDSFFNVGRDRRNAFATSAGSLDKVVWDLIREELRERWWRWLLTIIPLGWCGLWAGGIASLALVPGFAVATWRAFRLKQALFLMYAAPPITMLALHAVVANHYTRYNLILIGPFAVGCAWLIDVWSAHRKIAVAA